MAVPGAESGEAPIHDFVGNPELDPARKDPRMAQSYLYGYCSIAEQIGLWDRTESLRVRSFYKGRELEGADHSLSMMKVSVGNIGVDWNSTSSIIDIVKKYYGNPPNLPGRMQERADV